MHLSRTQKVVFPGVREELVERALRKMAVQRQIEARLESDETNSKSIPIVFTLSQLRNELAAYGHAFKIDELREALDVLGGAMMRIEGIVNDDINGMAHPILLISYKRRRGDKTGDYTYYTRTNHIGPKTSVKDLQFAALWRIAAPVHPIRRSNCAESDYCELIRPRKGLTSNNEAGQRAETAWAKRQKRNLISASKRADLNGGFRADVVSTR